MHGSRNLAEEEKKGAVAMENFQRLWVLDVCQTDWELPFPEEIQEQVATSVREDHIRMGRIWRSSLAPMSYKKFPKLKHVLLHDLFSLQEICEAKMTAPMLESVRIRGCWALRRLPSIGHRNNRHRRPVVHCQEDWWTKLEWDGLQAGHDPSLYEPRYLSAYYKKRLLRGTVLR